MKQGFTIIEFLIVLSVLIIIITISAGAFSFLIKKSDLDSSTNNIINILLLARNKTIASEQAKQYGVYFDISSSPHRYILFQGPSYASRAVSFDEIYNLSAAIEFSNLVFSGSGNEVVFNRLDGRTDNSGNLVIRSLKANETRDIYVYSSGQISFKPESNSGIGLISDSRHVHLNLGWNIIGATTLRFDFINASQVKEISMADYFSGTEFNWSGEFLVNNKIQKFKIHTHQLEPITALCIHRDRDDNKNNEEVYIYIIQGGIEKEIAHYDNNQYATVYKGSYVWNQMEIQ